MSATTTGGPNGGRRHILDARLLSLPVRETLAAAHDPDPDEDRLLVVVSITDQTGNIGWGECSALNRATYTAEWAEGAFDVLASGERATWADQPMAGAAVAMALLDQRLKMTGRSLAEELGASATSIRAGAVVGLADDPDVTVESVRRLAEAGYRRAKLKVVPSTLDSVAAVRDAFADIELQIDGNGSFAAADIDRLADKGQQSGLTAIEQPFAPNDLESARHLIASCDIPVLADEPIASIDDAAALYESGALSGIVIKPPRVGGIAPAVDMLDWAARNGVAAAAGGMLESGLGRHALAAVAALDGFTITGDVSPARRWLASDPFDDLEFSNGDVLVPIGPGVAPDPDRDQLDRYCIRHSSIEFETSEAI